MSKINKAQKFLLWAAGYDSETAEHCSSAEISKMTTNGIMVLVPAFVALGSYTYAFNFIFQNLNAAIAGGFAAAIVVFMIDRGIMASGRPGSFSLGMLGRLLLACCIGFLIAEPIILKIFEDAIVEEQHTELVSKQTQTATSFDDKILSYRKELAISENKLEQLRKDYTAEMDGTGGSKIRNQGPIYQKKLEDYNTYQKAHAAKANEINNAIAKIELEKSSAKSDIQEHQASKLLGRMQTLHRIAQKDSIVFAAVWLLRLSFMLIELIPLFVKITPSGGRNTYYVIVDEADKEREQAFAMGTEERLKVKQQEEKLLATESFAKLCHAETQVLADNKEKDVVYLMNRALVVSEKKTDYIAKAAKKIKDPELLKDVIASIESAHDGYMATLNELIIRSNSNFSTGKS